MQYTYKDIEDACLSTKPVNRAMVEILIRDLYKALGCVDPAIIWAASPMQALAMITATANSYPLNGLCRLVFQPPPAHWMSEWTVDPLPRPQPARRTPSFPRLVELIMSDLSRSSSNMSAHSWILNMWAGDTRFWHSATYPVYKTHNFFETISIWNDIDRLMEVSRSVPFSHRIHELALEICINAGWWWPFHNVVVMCDRPDMLVWDSNRRLHNANGPALNYRDDRYRLYFWHGQQVPKEVIDGTWTVFEMFNEPNIEIRRCYIERMGWDWFIAEGHLQSIGDFVPDPGNPGQNLQLYSVPPTIMGAPMKLLVCVNGSPERDGTRRMFGIPVPPSVNTPLEAQAWIHNDPNHAVRMTEDLYSQLQRRC